jgi:hypothetical protein
MFTDRSSVSADPSSKKLVLQLSPSQHGNMFMPHLLHW